MFGSSFSDSFYVRKTEGEAVRIEKGIGHTTKLKALKLIQQGTDIENIEVMQGWHHCDRRPYLHRII